MAMFRQFSLGLAVFLILAIVIGLALVYFYVRVDHTFLVNVIAKRCTDLILNSNFFFVVSLLFAILLLSCARSLLGMILGLGPGHSRLLTIDGEGGQISVALDAVEEFLRRKGSAVSGVKDLQVNAEVSGGLLLVHTRLVLILARDIPSFSREFQGLLRNEVTKTLGFQNVKEVRVIIQKMVTEETAPGPVPAPEGTAEPALPAVSTPAEREDAFWADRSADERGEER